MCNRLRRLHVKIKYVLPMHINLCTHNELSVASSDAHEQPAARSFFKLIVHANAHGRFAIAPPGLDAKRTVTLLKFLSGMHMDNCAVAP